MRHSAWIVWCTGCTFQLADVASPSRDVGVDADASDAVVIEASCSPDLNTDSNHCGRCGHSCLGGACVSGACAAVNLAVGVLSPGGIAINDAHVFYTSTSNGTIFRINKDGTAPSIIGRDQTDALSLAYASGALAFTATGAKRVGIVPDVAVSGARTVATDQLVSWGYVAIDDGFVYWADQGGGNVMRSPRATSMPAKIATGEELPHSVLLDGPHVYWTTTTALVRANRDGSERKSIAALTEPQHLARMGAEIYVSSASAKTITRVPLDGSPPVIIASDQNEAHGLIADGSSLLWASASLMRWDGKTTTAFNASGGIHRIAADEAAVYWTEFAGSIKRKAK